MPSPIPIRNIYYLLCYAWNRLKEGELVDVGKVGTTELADLFATVLINGIKSLHKRGMELGYEAVRDSIAGVRGKVDLLGTESRFLRQHGRALCTFDELTSNTPANRILKSTIQRLYRTTALDRRLASELRHVIRYFASVDTCTLNSAAFSEVRLHGNNRQYKFLLHICQLVMSCCIPDKDGTQYRFRDFVQDEAIMPKLFEDFIFNFYRLHLSEANIKREYITWRASSLVDPELRHLPAMLTDISIRTPGRTLIIDTKFYREAMQSRFGKKTVQSSNLYQIFAYLKNLEVNDGMDARAEGLLLYPTVDHSIRLKYDVMGHSIGVCTVDLSRQWHEIDNELRSLVQ